MADRVLITTDDLEQAVRVNAALEQAGYDTATVSSLDDVRSAVRGKEPAAIILTGGLHESTAQRLLAAAREHAVSTLGLVESTDDDPSQIVVILFRNSEPVADENQRRGCFFRCKVRPGIEIDVFA